MKKGDIFEGKVIRTEFPNKGIIDIEGQKVIVKNALEGQIVRFSINKKRRDKVEGRLLEVIESSPLEQPAACKHFGICGGCRYQNLSYEQQLNLKKRQVEELIEKDWSFFRNRKCLRKPNHRRLSQQNGIHIRRRRKRWSTRPRNAQEKQFLRYRNIR